MEQHNSVSIDENVCKGCGLCVATCPKKVLVIATTRFNQKGYHPSSVAHAADCIACGMCGIICPDSAITVVKE